MNHQPFLLDINLKTPVIIKKRLMLDALLMAALEIENGAADIPLSEIPLRQTDGLSHGSQLFVRQDSIKSPVIFTKRCEFDAALYAEENNKTKYVSVPRGEAKIRMDTYESTHSNNVYFFGCGDIERVKALMSLIEGIGKRNTEGFGAISQFMIWPIKNDVSLLHGEIPMRPIPLRLWEKITDKPIDLSLRLLETWHFPYWEIKNREWCVCYYDNRVTLDQLRQACTN